MLAGFDEITWSLHVLFGLGQTPYFTWAESNANEGEQRVFHLHSIRLMWSTAFDPGLIWQNWFHHFGEGTWYLQVWCLGLWSLRIVNCWLKQIYFHLLFSRHRWWWNLMASFGKQGTCCAWCANLVWGVWSMAFLENRIFSCFGVVDRIWWLTRKQRSFILVVYERSLLIEFDEMTCSFCFRENVFDRIWWHHLKQQFFPFSFCEIFFERIYVVCAQPMLIEFDAITWEQRRFCACYLLLS